MAHTPHVDLAKRVQGAQVKVKVGSIYYHWRNPGQHYEVLAVGYTEWDENMVVVYKQINHPQPLVWVRRLRGEDGWLTPVEHNGIETPRFQAVKISP
jgi:hypothetical protein